MATDEVENLAESLLKSGLASGEKDALEKAEKMLGSKKVVTPEEKAKKQPADQTTLDTGDSSSDNA